MSGVSLFRMLDYSISIATFESMDSNDGGRLLQLAGMKVVFNTQIPRGNSRILSIQIWDRELQEWLPIERLKLYKFVTDSYLCSAYDPYPDFLGANGNYTLPGEIQGVIKDVLVQTAVADYLSQLDSEYDSGIKGRLVNNTEDFNVMDLDQTQEECPVYFYWSERRGFCFECPESAHVGWSDDRLEFEGQLSKNGGLIPNEETEASEILDFNETGFAQNATELFRDVLRGRILLTNRELTNFSVVPKAIPSWMAFVDLKRGTLSERYVVGGPPTFIASGDSLALDFIVGSGLELEAGAALGTVSFGILGAYARDNDQVIGDALGIRACDDYARDATFDIFLKISPPSELNPLGGLRWLGIAIMLIALLSALFFAGMLYRYRKTAILKTLQPLFLVTVCGGVFITVLTILPLSMDDDILSFDGCDKACVATPWLLR